MKFFLIIIIFAAIVGGGGFYFYKNAVNKDINYTCNVLKKYNNEYWNSKQDVIILEQKYSQKLLEHKYTSQMNKAISASQIWGEKANFRKNIEKFTGQDTSCFDIALKIPNDVEKDSIMLCKIIGKFLKKKNIKKHGKNKVSKKIVYFINKKIKNNRFRDLAKDNLYKAFSDDCAGYSRTIEYTTNKRWQCKKWHNYCAGK